MITRFPSHGLITPRLTLRPPEAADAPDLLRYYLANRDHFRQWVPLRSDHFYTLDAMQHRLADICQDMEAGNSLHLLLRRPGSDTIVGECGFTNIVRGPFEAC